MRAKSIANNLGGLTTIFTVPAGKKARLTSLYISNIDVNPASIDVYIEKDGGSSGAYIIRDALVPIQSALQVISNEILIEEGDSVILKPSHANRLDSFLSYSELITII